MFLHQTGAEEGQELDEQGLVVPGGFLYQQGEVADTVTFLLNLSDTARRLGSLYKGEGRIWSVGVSKGHLGSWLTGMMKKEELE